MPGMNSGLSPSDPTLVNAFRSALLHQGAVVLALVAFLLLLWATARAFRGMPATAASTGSASARAASTGAASAGTAATGAAKSEASDGVTRADEISGGVRGWSTGGGVRGWSLATSARAWAGEARARTLLRVGFGLLWVLDGLLQAQPKMAAGLPSGVIQPAAAASPAWVRHLVNWGGTIWSYHPIQAGAASVWIQLGIGIWLLVAWRGPMSRLAGAVSVVWGLIVWVFGESFGGIFAPGLTILFGAPGAVLIYVVAGALIALPESAWRSPRLGTLLLRGIGLFFLGMAVLQAWPGRGFWQGGRDGTLAGMIQTMAGTSQPHPLSQMVSGAASFTSSHGWGVNLFAVIALALLGAALLSARRPIVRYAVWIGAAFCLADWLLVEDLGFLGGLGTDPNSMIPLILLFTAGYLALTPQPQAQAQAREAGVAAGPGADRPSWQRRLRPADLSEAFASVSVQSVTAVAAAAVILVGAAPMAAAAANRTADPILAEAISGDTTALDIPAPGFQLTDQNGRTVSLSSLRGKVVLLTFLDPVCTTDCPIIGAEFRQAAVQLGASGKNVELVAVVANPTYRSLAAMRAFDAEEGLTTMPNWLYLTGSLSTLQKIWQQYGIIVANVPAGAMSAHNDLAFVIDRSGTIRIELNTDPGPGTTSTKSSFSVLLANYARQALAER